MEPHEPRSGANVSRPIWPLSVFCSVAEVVDKLHDEAGPRSGTDRSFDFLDPFGDERLDVDGVVRGASDDLRDQIGLRDDRESRSMVDQQGRPPIGDIGSSRNQRRRVYGRACVDRRPRK